MPIDFPSSPTNGQVYTSGGTTWVYDSSVPAWNLQAQTITGATGPTGPSGDPSLTLNAQTGTTYTLALTDASKLVTLDNASAISLTVPLNSTAAFATGTQINIAQKGAGQVTVAGASGVTVRSSQGLKLRVQYSFATLVKVATDEWYLTGDTIT